MVGHAKEDFLEGNETVLVLEDKGLYLPDLEFVHFLVKLKLVRCMRFLLVDLEDSCVIFHGYK